KGLGGYAGGGDFDGDGREDIAWSDPSDGIVTLWLNLAAAPTAVVVNRALPAGGTVVSGATSSDDGMFRQGFCSGDLNGNGVVNGSDLALFKKCVDQPRNTQCNRADMNSDGWIDMAGDYPIFELRFQGKTCEPW